MVPVEALRPGVDPRIAGIQHARWTTLPVGRERRPHLETVEFDTLDDWSLGFRGGISDLKGWGEFNGKEVTELGAGDIRNIRLVADVIAYYRAIELSRNRLAIARANIAQDPLLQQVGHELIEGDAVEWLDTWPREKGSKRLTGWVFICLPQSPEGDDTTDIYDPRAQRLAPYINPWDRYGLTLNAAVLHKLRAIVDPERSDVFIVNSHRVAEDVRLGVIEWAGWRKHDEIISKPIHQDPNTGIGWIHRNGIDDGKRFYEETPSGGLRYLRADVAETRRLEAMRDNSPRQNLNVLHQLSFYWLKPAPSFSLNGKAA